MTIWQLQEAKNKFSSVVNLALTQGPQYVSRHGKKSVVVLSVETYEDMMRQRPSLLEFLRSVPLHELDIERDQGGERDLDGSE